MATNLDIQKMYIAYFGRPADVSGLTYWTNQITQANGNASAVINAFSASAEYADNYAGKSNEFIVNSLYNNLFGRDAEVDGLTYWSGKLLDGTFSVGNVAWAIMSGAQNEDVTALGNKATAAQTFTNSMDTTSEILGYSGSAAAAAAKAWLVTVTDTQASLDAAVASVDTAVSDTVAAGSSSQGQTFTLTTGTDDKTGSSGNDTFTATASTLTALDKIDGGTGIDTLKITDAEGAMNTAIPAGMTITSVEKMTVQTAGSVGAVASGGTTAQQQINTYLFGSVGGATDTIVVNYGSVTSTITVGANVTAAGDAFAAAINAAAGQTIAVNTTGSVVVTAPTAGTALPAITFGAITGTTVLPTITFTQANVAYVAPTSTTAVYDISGIADLTDATITSATGVNLKAAATTDVHVSGVTGNIALVNGKDVSVTDAGAAHTITIGGSTTTNPAGKITVTDTDNSGANAIAVTGGTDVTITTTADKATSAAITVGHATNGMATGAVVVTQNSTSNGTAMTAGNVTIVGGSTVAITANMTNTATTGNGGNITAAAFNVTASDTTSSVTITQNSTATDLAAVTTGNKTETAAVTFGALAIGESVWIHAAASSGKGTDLTFTASKALSGAEVAAAFANLIAADTQAAGGIVANGYFTGKLDAGYTSSAVSGATVTVTATTADTDVDSIGVTTEKSGGGGTAIKAADFKSVVTAGAAGTTVAAQNVTADYGTVVINDNATKSITTITLNGYDTATLGAGASGSLNALTTLSLSNSAGANALTTTATTLALNLDAITGSTGLGGSVETLTVTTSGTASATALTAGGLKYLTVNAAANLTVTPTSIAALETLTVTGAGNVTMGDISAATTTITAGTATGAISATVDGTKATVTTGSGADSITVNTASITKAITLGDGNDTFILNTDSTTVPTATVDGGNGTEDTVSMTIVSAAGLDGNTNFAAKVINFERLTIRDTVGTDNNTAATTTIDMAALGYGYVTTTGTVVDVDASTTESDDLVLDNMNSGETVVLTAKGYVSVLLDDATGTDTFNVIVNAEDVTVDVGEFTINDVETINITAKGVFTDTDSNGVDDTADIATLVLSADAVTSIVVDGYANLDLTTDSTVLATIDAHTMTGALTYTIDDVANDFLLQSGSGKDDITVDASNNAQVKAGDGDDTITLTADAVSANIWGGNGNDTFDVTNTISSATQYATIEDATSGDVIILDTAKFLSGSVSITDFDLMSLTDKFGAVLGDTGLNTGTGFAISFQHVGNTYIVVSDGTAGSSFGAAGTDQVIKLTGLYTFSTDASFNSTDGTLEIA